jgi:hypothetical protein
MPHAVLYGAPMAGVIGVIAWIMVCDQVVSIASLVAPKALVRAWDRFMRKLAQPRRRFNHEDLRRSNSRSRAVRMPPHTASPDGPAVTSVSTAPARL